MHPPMSIITQTITADSQLQSISGIFLLNRECAYRAFESGFVRITILIQSRVERNVHHCLLLLIIDALYPQLLKKKRSLLLEYWLTLLTLIDILGNLYFPRLDTCDAGVAGFVEEILLQAFFSYTNLHSQDISRGQAC